MGIRKLRHQFIAIANPQAMRSFFATLMLVPSLLLPTLSPAAVYVAGDLAPIDAPDGKLNVADVLILQRFIIGDLTPTSQDILLGDVAPLDNPDGQLNVADVAVLMRAVHGAVSLQPVLIRPDPPNLDRLPAITNDNPLMITGTTTPDMEVRLYVNGTQQAPTTSSATDGSFSFNTILLDGNNTIYTTTWDGSDESLPSDNYIVDYQNNIPRVQDNITIIDDTVWTPVWAPDSIPTPYTITGTLTVQEGKTFTIQPGATLQFESGAKLFVGGTLIIQGDENNSVLLTGTNQTIGGWEGVEIYKTSTSSVIKNAVIEKASTAIIMNGTRATIQDNVISEFQYYGVYIRNGASGYIDNNYVDGRNGLSTTGIFIMDPLTSPSLERNIIRNANVGIWISDGSTPEITNGNRITNNNYGLYLQGGKSSPLVDPKPEVTGNSIYDNGISETGTRTDGRDYYTLSWDDPGMVLDATGNWWGTNDLNAVANRVREVVDNPTSPIVNFGNYLDTDGGQPVQGNYIYGEVDETTLQLTQGETYIPITTLTVPVGKTLTIPQGVKFNFRNNTGVIVNGAMLAQGSTNSPVIFDSVNLNPTAGDWSGIHVNLGGAVNIDYADIQHAAYGMRFYAASTGTVSNSTITLNDYGINAYGDNGVNNNPAPVVKNNNIYDNGIVNGARKVGRDYYANQFGDAANVVLDAKNNWWGTNDISEIANRIYEYTDNSINSPVVNFGYYLDSTDGNIVSGNYLYGRVNDATHLLQQDIRYTVISTLTVPAGNDTWTVPAGAQLLFTPNTELLVNGNLLVNGLQNKKVIFTSVKPNPAVSDWKGIKLNSGASLLMDFAIVEYAQNGLYFDTASGSVSNSLIQFNMNGIYITGATDPVLGLTISSNRIVNNSIHGIELMGVLDSDYTNDPTPTITGNDIYGNDTLNQGYGEFYISNYGINSPVVIDLTNNWWGTDTPREGFEIKIGGNTPGYGNGFVDFSGFATTPWLSPVITGFTISNVYISPNGDGNNDTTTITAAANTNANWTLTITDATASVIRSFTETGTQLSKLWDGLDASSQIVPDGAYRVDIQATDATTGAQLVPVSGSVTANTMMPIAIISLPTNSETLADSIVITGTAKGALDNAGLNYTLEYASSLSPDSWTQFGSGSFQDNNTLASWITNSYRDEELVPNGVYTVRLTVKDSLSGTVASDQVTVNIDNMLITNVIRTNDIINPVRNETASINFDINQSANVVLRIVPETVTVKTYPDQTPEAEAVRIKVLGTLNAGSHNVSWDGRDDAGNFVVGDAYIYTIEANSLTGLFDKFNEHVVKTYGQIELLIPSSDVVSYNPYKNEFISSTFTNTYGAFRGSFCVAYTNTQGQRTDIYPYPQNNIVWPSEPISVFWNGRDNSGEIATGFQSIVYEICGTVGQFASGVKNNYIIVSDGRPDVPGVSIKSDPYLIHLSYGQLTNFKYSLLDDANVTVSVREPDTGVETILQDNVPQTVGDYEVPWAGSASDGGLVPTAGHYTLIVRATHPDTGQSIVRVGNISIFQ